MPKKTSIGLALFAAASAMTCSINRFLRFFDPLRRPDPGTFGLPFGGFPGHGQMKPEQLEIARLKREVTKLKAERDILKNCHGPMPACAR